MIRDILCFLFYLYPQRSPGNFCCNQGESGVAAATSSPNTERKPDSLSVVTKTSRKRSRNSVSDSPDSPWIHVIHSEVLTANPSCSQHDPKLCWYSSAGRGEGWRHGAARAFIRSNREDSGSLTGRRPAGALVVQGGGGPFSLPLFSLWGRRQTHQLRGQEVWRCEEKVWNSVQRVGESITRKCTPPAGRAEAHSHEPMKHYSAQMSTFLWLHSVVSGQSVGFNQNFGFTRQVPQLERGLNSACITQVFLKWQGLARTLCVNLKH